MLETHSDYFNAGITYILGGIVILTPFSVLGFLLWNKLKLHDNHFSSKYDSMYEGYNLYKKVSIWYIFWFLLRRLIFSASTVFLTQYPAV